MLLACDRSADTPKFPESCHCVSLQSKEQIKALKAQRAAAEAKAAEEAAKQRAKQVDSRCTVSPAQRSEGCRWNIVPLPLSASSALWVSHA